nr:hypothetical protein GCM10020093_113500 [Planobispora longispora]
MMMYQSDEAWREVDAYFAGALVPEDRALREARESGGLTTMPQAEVAPNQGKLLAMLCRIAGAVRVLEFGTLAGYSTIWLARAVGDGGHVTSLELEERNAAIARENLERAGWRTGWTSSSARPRTRRGGSPRTGAGRTTSSSSTPTSPATPPT